MLKGKIGLVCGVLNNMSIAWKVAEHFLANGAQVILTYQKSELLSKLDNLTKHVNCTAEQCDVSNESSINDLYEKIKNKYNNIDFLVHSIAFADKNELKGKYYNTSRENFLNSMNISCYSFTALIQKFHTIMNENSSCLTMTYYGAEKFMPNYNVMGVCKAALEASVKYLAVDLGEKNIRVNGLSAGTLKTLASYGINNFHNINNYTGQHSALRRNVSIEEVAKAALFLTSDQSSGITGEIMHVDCGYNVVGMPPTKNLN